MGVEIHDESLEEYDGYAFPLVEGSVIEGGNLDYVKELAFIHLQERRWKGFEKHFQSIGLCRRLR